jgi:hypothetical protein
MGKTYSISLRESIVIYFFVNGNENNQSLDVIKNDDLVTLFLFLSFILCTQFSIIFLKPNGSKPGLKHIPISSFSQKNLFSHSLIKFRNFYSQSFHSNRL